MALSCFDKESAVEVTGGIASVHYIELTVAALAKYGINVERDGDTFKVPGKPSDIALPDGNFEVEGDWSNGAFLLCLGSLIHGGSAKVTGLNMESVQGDREIMHFLRLAGITFLAEGDTVFVQDSRFNPVRKLLEMDCSDIPDIVPATSAPLSFTCPLSKDNYYFAVRALSAQGHPGLPAVAR